MAKLKPYGTVRNFIDSPPGQATCRHRDYEIVILRSKDQFAVEYLFHCPTSSVICTRVYWDGGCFYVLTKEHNLHNYYRGTGKSVAKLIEEGVLLRCSLEYPLKIEDILVRIDMALICGLVKSEAYKISSTVQEFLQSLNHYSTLIGEFLKWRGPVRFPLRQYFAFLIRSDVDPEGRSLLINAIPTELQSRLGALSHRPLVAHPQFRVFLRHIIDTDID